MSTVVITLRGGRVSGIFGLPEDQRVVVLDHDDPVPGDGDVYEVEGELVTVYPVSAIEKDEIIEEVEKLGI